MEGNYQKIVQENLGRLFSRSSPALVKTLPAVRDQGAVIFQAFGRECRIQPDGILLGNEPQNDVLGILISLYALNATTDSCRPEPLKAFKDFPNSMPYWAAFAARAEQILVPHVQKINTAKEKVFETLNGKDASDTAGCDFSFLVYPLPKIALCYIFYEADEDFSASATCLFSSNANQFMPIDGLADVAEYTSKAILDIVYE
jgi:hypothetical protein